MTATPWWWRPSSLGVGRGCAMGAHQTTALAIAASSRHRASTNSVATSNAVQLTAIGSGVGFRFVGASASWGARRP